MGRSRVPSSADEDPSQRTKRKRNASSGDNLESGASDQGSNEGKRALYHCNYCNKDISGKIRIKCAKCPDFDLCVECFSVGAEVTPHKSNHPYRVMDNLSFPLICPDWNADEEILLLEGIEMYGMGNWAEIAEHVGTKIKAQCIDHYTTIYMNSPCFPLPDMSHVVGKNRKELLAMAKGHAEGKKGFPMFGDLTLKEESPFSPSRVKIEDLSKEAPAGRSPSSLNVDSGVGSGNTNLMATSSVKKASNMAKVKDGPDSVKVEDCQVDRSVGGQKPKSLSDEGPSMTELSGYNPKRQEFDPEYDNDAEQSLAEMEFKETDTEAERELKLRVLRIYLKRLDERKCRKDFILERNLLFPNPLEKELSYEEREIYQRYKVFMRFHSKEEHEQLIRTIIEEHRIQKRIRDLQEARAAGCRLSAEADRYIEQKRKKETEENARKVKESTQSGPSGKVLQRINRPKGEPDGSPRGGVKGSLGLDSSGKDSSSTAVKQATACALDDWDITGYPGTDLLSETEQQLCRELKLLPPHYLSMQQTMSVEILIGNITRKSDAYRFFKVEPSKVDRVYDMLVKKGIAQP
ncbi:transcriptional adapter ADA2-like isoform X2 [Telopea speciosissima]|uniref:transcriptional adapter ADA2-like isoform X2 n=1 Tax=Telopea speciosissima TaxID=54955 RepID=UPI001CC75F01|nr:transcriptional adapter ADA2-like isoform X2 [Telopea speciosissima]